MIQPDCVAGPSPGARGLPFVLTWPNLTHYNRLQEVGRLARKPKNEVNIPDFEKALKQLETLVEQLESGDDSLEDSLRRFEEGIALSRQCQEALKVAEQRVRVLIENKAGEAATLEDFEEREDA
ncbi:MAG: exodeoxyribonuclease VII small subunit [Gammaproteobacteria bacterium]|nr:exodeoxyribonuclease VII small subunit [Gammaproteobacteria bacterium]